MYGESMALNLRPGFRDGKASTVPRHIVSVGARDRPCSWMDERRQTNHPDAGIPIRLAAPVHDRDLANDVVCIRGQEFPGFVDQYLKQPSFSNCHACHARSHRAKHSRPTETEIGILWPTWCRSDATAPHAVQHPLEDLPVDVLIYLLGSRYCETDRLSNLAWTLFGQHQKGWPLVQAICDYVHHHITFGYAFEWRIEYRGKDCVGVSPDPADSENTFRVLTLYAVDDVLAEG
jgi:hypothetical protein